MQEGCGIIYFLIGEDRGWDKSAFSTQKEHSGTYMLIIKDRGWDGRSSTCILVVDDRVRNQSGFSVQERHCGTYILLRTEGEIVQCSACGSDAAALTAYC